MPSYDIPAEHMYYINIVDEALKFDPMEGEKAQKGLYGLLVQNDAIGKSQM